MSRPQTEFSRVKNAGLIEAGRCQSRRTETLELFSRVKNAGLIEASGIRTSHNRCNQFSRVKNAGLIEALRGHQQPSGDAFSRVKNAGLIEARSRVPVYRPSARFPA